MNAGKLNIDHRFDSWIFKSFPMYEEALGLYRIAYSLYLLVWGIPNFEWIAGSPNSFFNPPPYSIAALFSSFPPYWFLQGLSIATVIFSIALLFGWKTRWVSILLGLSIILGKSFAFSFGMIGQDIIVWFVPILLAFANWGAAFSIDNKLQDKNTVQNWPVTMMALLLGFGMFTAGLPKLLGGWLDISTQATRGHFYTQYLVVGDLKILAPFMRQLTNDLVWEAMDWVAVFFELSFLVAVLKPKWFRTILCLAILFHTSTFLVFNISFHFQYSVYLLFINWAFIPSWFYSKLSIVIQKVFTLPILFLVTALYLALYIPTQELMTQPGLLAPSPFLMAAELMGFDYKIVVGVTALIPAWIIMIWQLTAKRNS